ncbi:MAG: hypothetical protein ABIG93_02775 [archaeon]|nr:hypothetical protein [Nanoarchaeota archaeon]
MIIPQISAQAAQTPPEALQFLQPLAEIMGPFLSILSWLMGGVFGVYVILLIVRIYYEHRKLKILKEIRNYLIPPQKKNGKNKK